MAWIALTINDLNNAKVAALVNALRTAARAPGQADPSTDIIATVTARIRGEVAGCASNVLDADTTKIPASLRSLAARMAVREMQSRLQLELNETERDEMRADERLLERINSCKVPVEAADNPITSPEPYQSTTGTPRIVTKKRRFSRERQEGA